MRHIVSTVTVPDHPKDQIMGAFHDTLVDIFGGYTRVPGYGAWKDGVTGKIEHEAVLVYTIIFQDSIANLKRFLGLVKGLGYALKQKEMLCVINGNPQFINTRETPAVNPKKLAA